MDTLQAAATTLLDWLLETSVQVAVLVVLVALAQLVLRRWLTPRWRYGLWLLVLVRLMVPALPPSPVSVFNVSPAISGEVAGVPDPVPTAFAPTVAPRKTAPRICT